MTTRPQTLSVFTENHTGLVHRVTSVFTRRNINIESMIASESEVPGIHRFTIVICVDHDYALKLAAQLEKQIEVIKAVVHQEDEIITRELALYKIERGPARKDPAFEGLLRSNRARVLEDNADYLVVEKNGTQAETTDLLVKLQPYGVLEFVRSGTVALTRPMKTLHAFLEELEAARGSTT